MCTFLGEHCDLDIQECASNPCSNGATCLEPEVNMFQCSCALGTSGTLCTTVSQASFTGVGYITLPPLAQLIEGGASGAGGGGVSLRKRRAVDRVAIEMTFVTTVPSGVIFYDEGVSMHKLIVGVAILLYFV